MGKKDPVRNIPTNPSLSWTLEHLQTEVVLREASEDQWSPLHSDYPLAMSEVGRAKYLKHLQRMKDFFSLSQHFHIQSANNFPADCGVASSASSFAALTEVCCQAFSELTGKSISQTEKVGLSALGSGSSCRSFMPGLVIWDEEGVRPYPAEGWRLSHMVILVGQGAKKVSSSSAHQRVASSSLFGGRVERSQQRLTAVTAAVDQKNWTALYQTLWAEFWDMHALFETSAPSFGYFLPGTIEVLQRTRQFWERMSDGPLVTMDAGPNIHLLWQEGKRDLALQFFKENLQDRWTCLSDIQEIGFAKV
jgi:diphosphomevalonate decarboxylase